MFGKIIGAVAGSKIANSTRGIGGPGGAVLGIGVAAIAKRLSIPAMIAISAGGYFAKKYWAKKEPASTTPKKAPPKVKSSAT